VNPKNEWKLIDWDGNPDLHYKCWRKKFGRGHVSVGCGEFLGVVFSYGENSEDSFSGTRWDYDRPPISEEDMMKRIDRSDGKGTGPKRTWTTPEHAPEHMREEAREYARNKRR
jgi:hypothetical protein